MPEYVYVYIVHLYVDIYVNKKSDKLETTNCVAQLLTGYMQATQTLMIHCCSICIKYTL